MGERFDEYSKHLATTHSRRGLLKFLGAGFIGAAVSTALPKGTDASMPRGGVGVPQAMPHINQTLPPYGPPQLNATRPVFPNINATLPFPNINSTLPQINQFVIDDHIRNFLHRLFQRLRNP
jgi:hypothetical protein